MEGSENSVSFARLDELLLEEIWQLKSADFMKNVKIVCKDGVVYGSSLLLGVWSKVVRDVMAGEEYKGDKMLVLLFPDISSRMMTKLLLWSFQGNVIMSGEQAREATDALHALGVSVAFSQQLLHGRRSVHRSEDGSSATEPEVKGPEKVLSNEGSHHSNNKIEIKSGITDKKPQTVRNQESNLSSTKSNRQISTVSSGQLEMQPEQLNQETTDNSVDEDELDFEDPLDGVEEVEDNEEGEEEEDIETEGEDQEFETEKDGLDVSHDAGKEKQDARPNIDLTTFSKDGADWRCPECPSTGSGFGLLANHLIVKHYFKDLGSLWKINDVDAPCQFCGNSLFGNNQNCSYQFKRRKIAIHLGLVHLKLFDVVSSEVKLYLESIKSNTTEASSESNAWNACQEYFKGLNTSCDVCSTKMTTPPSLRAHLATYHYSEELQKHLDVEGKCCKLCGKVIPRYSGKNMYHFIKHVAFAHAEALDNILPDEGAQCLSMFPGRIESKKRALAERTANRETNRPAKRSSGIKINKLAANWAVKLVPLKAKWWNHCKQYFKSNYTSCGICCASELTPWILRTHLADWHYRDEVIKHIDPIHRSCRLCGREMGRKRENTHTSIKHVAFAHPDVLYELLPPEIVKYLKKFPSRLERKAGRNSEVSQTMEDPCPDSHDTMQDESGEESASVSSTQGLRCDEDLDEGENNNVKEGAEFKHVKSEGDLQRSFEVSHSEPAVNDDEHCFNINDEDKTQGNVGPKTPTVDERSCGSSPSPTTSPVFRCFVCPKSFHSVRRMRCHMALVHFKAELLELLGSMGESSKCPFCARKVGREGMSSAEIRRLIAVHVGMQHEGLEIVAPPQIGCQLKRMVDSPVGKKN